MRRVFMMFLVVIAFSQVSLLAQDAPAAEVFGGFSWLTISDEGERVNPVGWQASVAGHVTPTFAVVGDFGGQYKDGSSIYQYLGGVRGHARREKATAFVHGMAGGSRFSDDVDSENGFTLALGGGFDVSAGDRVAIRILQFDWLPSRFSGEWETNIFRFGFGIVFKSGSR